MDEVLHSTAIGDEAALDPPQEDTRRPASLFQPIYRLALQQPVGYEALIREYAPDGHLQLPAALSATADGTEAAIADLQSHQTHLTSIADRLPPLSWLFLNINGRNLGRAGYALRLSEMVRAAGMRPHQIVLEVLESTTQPLEDLSEQIRPFKDAGFLVALDDYGAGHSNLNRALYLRPHIVKLDRCLIQNMGNSGRLIPNLVRLLHEAGILVVAEGIETVDELLLAVRANVDLAQGYLLGRPLSDLSHDTAAAVHIDAAYERNRAETLRLADERSREMDDYEVALRCAVERLAARYPLAASCATLLKRPECIGCFVLDGHGRQLGSTEWGPAAKIAKPGFAPLSTFNGARWDNRDYYLQAISRPGRVIHTTPYRSVTGAQLCVTLAIAFPTPEGTQVLGVDVRA